MKQTDLDETTKDIAQKYINPVVSLSLREIQDFIFLRTGKKPALGLIGESLRRNGFKLDGHRWIYQHNEGKHE